MVKISMPKLQGGPVLAKPRPVVHPIGKRVIFESTTLTVYKPSLPIICCYNGWVEQEVMPMLFTNQKTYSLEVFVSNAASSDFVYLDDGTILLYDLFFTSFTSGHRGGPI